MHSTFVAVVILLFASPCLSMPSTSNATDIPLQNGTTATSSNDTSASTTATTSSSCCPNKSSLPAGSWPTYNGEHFYSSVDACGRQCNVSCVKLSPVEFHNLLFMYARGYLQCVNSYTHDPFNDSNGASCGSLDNANFRNVTIDAITYYTSPECKAESSDGCTFECRSVRYDENFSDALRLKNWTGVVLFECDKFPRWLLGLTAGLGSLLVGIILGMSFCCCCKKRKKNDAENDDAQTPDHSDANTSVLHKNVAVASGEFRRDNVQSSPLQTKSVKRTVKSPVESQSAKDDSWIKASAPSLRSPLDRSD